MEKTRRTWASRSTFILAAIGSAVGLGNAWRFPGLAAKYGGGSFLMVYLMMMLLMGIPLLAMEIAIGRKMHRGSAGAMAGMNKKFEPIGWAATSNAFIICTYYAVVFAWVIIMAVMAGFKYAGLTGNSEAASNLFYNTIQLSDKFTNMEIPIVVIVGLIVAWAAIYYCIRNGVQSVGKVVKYTVFLPVVFLVIMAIKGVTMPNAGAGLEALFVPDLSALSNASLWVDATGQVFYSLSIMMAIMFAYGSYLDDKANIAFDTMIIAFADMAVSVLSGIVLFTTMYGTGTAEKMTDSGIATAFVVYPTAIVNLTNTGWFNALFGVVFYLCLVTLAIDSAFSIAEGVATSFADKFKISHKKATLVVCILAAVISLLYATKSGLYYLDIVDHWTNMINLLIIGILECVAIGWCFNISKVMYEVNRNTKKFKMPGWWFITSIKILSPALLTVLIGWNLNALFKNNGVYGGYPTWMTSILGWLISGLIFASGFVIYFVADMRRRNGKAIDEPHWIDDAVEAADESEI